MGKDIDNVYDYLDWRGDIPFSINPLNEVDALIFSVLSYTDMTGLFSGPEESLSIRTLSQKYIDAGVDQSHLVYDPGPLLKKCAETRRFGDVLVSHYADIFESDKETQFSACSFQISDKEVFVSFRGTDNTLIGWREDCNMTSQKLIPAQRQAAEYLNSSNLERFDIIYTGGHSKGGNLAMYGSAFCRPEIRDKIKAIYSNDGPGFRKELWESDKIKSVLSKVISVIPDTSVIGLLLNHAEDQKIIDSALPPFLSHDPYSWKVKGTSFQPKKELSSISLYIIDVLNQWLETITDKERAEFIDTIFNSVAETGITKVAELRKDPLKTYKAIYDAFSRSDPAKKQMVMELLSRLAKTGTDTVFQELKKVILPQKQNIT